MDNNKVDDITEKNVELEEITKETLKEISHILATSDEQLVYDFLECIFTPTERKDISNRWLLVKEIEKGTTQREIAKKFGMSLCKITRGSRELNKPDSAFRRVLELQKK
ncbi:MAG: trp operon repressor [Treponema sp.]|nr:trp operon repressor [Treponema sp.]